MDAVGRNWIGIEEHISLRELTGATQSEASDDQVNLHELQAVQALLKMIVVDLVQVCPDMCRVSPNGCLPSLLFNPKLSLHSIPLQNELPAMLDLSPSFAGLVAGHVDNSRPNRSAGAGAANTPSHPPPLPSRRPETHETAAPQPPPMPPRDRVSVPAQNPAVASPPVLPPRGSAASATPTAPIIPAASRDARFVPPVPTGGMMQAPRAPPRRTVEPVEAPSTSGHFPPFLSCADTEV